MTADLNSEEFKDFESVEESCKEPDPPAPTVTSSGNTTQNVGVIQVPVKMKDSTILHIRIPQTNTLLDLKKMI